MRRRASDTCSRRAVPMALSAPAAAMAGPGRQWQGLGIAHQTVDLGECAQFRRQTSVTAGTIMYVSKLPLTIWFWAAYLMATHSNGISALQLQRQLALGSYKSAWLLCAKLRSSMVAPDRSPLAGLVEVDETAIACRSQHDPVSGGGGAVTRARSSLSARSRSRDGGPGRIRLAAVPDYAAASLHLFIADNLAPGATATADGWSAYPGAPASRTIRMSSARSPLMSSCAGATASSPTSSSGPGCLPRPAPPSSAILSRRVRVSLQPPPNPSCRVPLITPHCRRPPTAHLQHADLTGSKAISLFSRSVFSENP